MGRRAHIAMRFFTSPSGGPARVALFLSLGLIGLALPVTAQENVTIPKSRLEELEKKEAELEKLRNQVSTKKPVPVSKTTVPATNSQAPVPVTVAAEAAPAPAQVLPPPTPLTLPSLKEGEVVSAIDLASHFQQDPAAAQQRYHKQSFAVQGEIERFEKAAFSRSYNLIMKTGGSNLKVVCEVYPPEPFTAVFTASQGSQIVGVFGDNRKTLASADSIAVVRGECKALKGSIIVFKGCALKSVRPVGN